MPALGLPYTTMAQFKVDHAEDGSPLPTINVVADTRHWIQDALLIEGNKTDGHETSQVVSLPPTQFRRMYGGVTPGADGVASIVDKSGLLETLNLLDERLVSQDPNPMAFRARKDNSHAEAMVQRMETTFFYGDTDANPDEFHGLMPRYNDLSAGRNAGQIVVGHASPAGATQTSIWSVQWHPEGIHCFYPRGQQGGYRKNDAGLEYVDAVSGSGQFRAWRTQHCWEMGLAIPDYRSVVRICNIDADLRDAYGATEMEQLRQALILGINSHEHDPGWGNQVLYMNRATKTALQIMATQPGAAGMALTPMNYFGVMVDSIMGIPIRIADSILDTESIVS